MYLHTFLGVAYLPPNAMAMVKIDDDTRDELRKFKAEHGMTYDEAVTKLLKNSGWIHE